MKFNEDVKVDSQLLFQRLVVVRERCDELPLVLKHELSSYPLALFEEPGMMQLEMQRKLEKAGCCCFHANEYADLMIVKTVLNSSNKIDTLLIGEDTELLVLSELFDRNPLAYS